MTVEGSPAYRGSLALKYRLRYYRVSMNAQSPQVEANSQVSVPSSIYIARESNFLPIRPGLPVW